MSAELLIEVAADVLEVDVDGKLTAKDYQRWVPEVERMIREHGKINMVFVMRNFHGWSAGALWQDLKFDVHHFSDIKRLAIVGDKKWERGMATFCKPFTTAKVRFFELGRLEEARQWASHGE